MESGYNDSKGFNLDYYETNSEWDIANTSWHVYQDKQDAAINFKTTLKRKPMYFMMSVLLPICMLSILNICVFMILVNSGEKASYAVTVFLSFAVFLSIASDTYPKNSDSIPLFTTFLAMQTTVSAMTTMLALVFSRLESFGDAKVPGPLVKLMKIRNCHPCLSRGNKTKVHVVKPMENADNSTDSLKNEPPVEVYWKDAVNFLDFVCFVLFSIMFILSTMICFYFALSKGRVFNEELEFKSMGMYEQNNESGHDDGVNNNHTDDYDWENSYSYYH
ncbi:hypothetical protein DPMN_124122 [Dreissena polymorpha]|uniref:Neurotransmitter-gated ion-channel transmembrane domain-containing protein n=1 Tax=Dreissena polymorpha TaxID=45954 RepID=A0A9D4GVI9_DREPO|nr:hypothetical protein DPMN_124122 [Dreissena polymorpha]